MGFILKDKASAIEDIYVNRWNWRPTIELIKTFAILDIDRLEMMGYNGTGMSVSAEEAYEIGQRLQKEILPKLTPKQRILYDLRITDEPDDGIFHRDDITKNYGATYDWLKKFSEFCLASHGFEVL